MRDYIVTQNHANLVTVLHAVSLNTFDKDVKAAADKMISVVGGDSENPAMLVGISADRGLPYISFAKSADALHDTNARKVAIVGKFYRKYVDKDATQDATDKLTQHLLMQADRLGFGTPDASW